MRNCLTATERYARFSVIDNVTRITVQSLEFNTDELNMSVGASAELIPIINPKDVFNNGMLNSNLTWSSTNESVASVSDGRICKE